jgi:hypothetical protein
LISLNLSFLLCENRSSPGGPPEYEDLETVGWNHLFQKDTHNDIKKMMDLKKIRESMKN